MSQVVKEGPDVEFVLNEALKLRGVTVEWTGGRLRLRFPARVSRSGWSLPSVFVSDPDLETRLERATLGKRSRPGRPGIASFEVIEFQPYLEAKRPTRFATVRFGEGLNVRCVIREGTYGPWVAWPTRLLAGGKRLAFVAFPDRDLKARVETELLERFVRTLSEEKPGTP